MKDFHPTHIYQCNTIYFITAKTLRKEKFFDISENKKSFFNCLSKSVERFNLELIAWVLLDNHYHVILKSGIGKTLGSFINNLHSNSARVLNKLSSKIGRQVWYQYWDRCIRSEKDFYVRLNYIHHNPVKHKLVSKMEDYNWSSYNEYVKRYGIDWINDCFQNYPIIDFTLEDND